MLDDPTHFAWVDERHRYERRDPRPFDRVAFAMWALDVLRPRRMTVAVYPSAARAVRVERGRDLSATDATWALVGIPADASRESIALALAELAGQAGAPFVLDLLLADGPRSGPVAT